MMRSIIFFCVAMWMSCAAQAAFVDYALLDIGPVTQQVESGWTGVGTAASNANNSPLGTTGLVSLTTDAFDIAINSNNGAGTPTGTIDWRDRGNQALPVALGRIGEDFIKNNGGHITVVLTGLQPGNYQVTGYHLDPDNTQSNLIEMRIQVGGGSPVLQADTGSAGVDVPGASTADEVNNMTTAQILGTSSFGSFTQLSESDVITIHFDGTLSADDETPLNGLYIQFEAIPEPSTGLLLTASVAGGFFLIRRRTRKS